MIISGFKIDKIQHDHGIFTVGGWPKAFVQGKGKLNDTACELKELILSLLFAYITAKCHRPPSFYGVVRYNSDRMNLVRDEINRYMGEVFNHE